MAGSRRKSLQKSLQIYLSKLKKAPPSHLPIHSNSFKTSSPWSLSSCRLPKTSSFSVDPHLQHNPKFDEAEDDDDDDDEAATLTDIDRFLFENFKTLYCKTDGDGGKSNSNASPRAFLFESPRLSEVAPPDVKPSNRFFVSPGTSSSLMEESSPSLSTSDESISTTTTMTTDRHESMAKRKSINDIDLPDDSIAVLTYTRDPYEDFRQSMEEMVEARLNQHETVGWDFMEELLFCYLKLNDKNSYKYILGAFVDLMVVLRQNSGDSPAKPRKLPSKMGERRKGEER